MGGEGAADRAGTASGAIPSDAVGSRRVVDHPISRDPGLGSRAAAWLASADRVVATMPVEGNTQPYGLLHGGASVVLAETVGCSGGAPFLSSSRSICQSSSRNRFRLLGSRTSSSDGAEDGVGPRKNVSA